MLNISTGKVVGCAPFEIYSSRVSENVTAVLEDAYFNVQIFRGLELLETEKRKGETLCGGGNQCL